MLFLKGFAECHSQERNKQGVPCRYLRHVFSPFRNPFASIIFPHLQNFKNLSAPQIMQFLLRPTKRVWPWPSVRKYTASSFLLQHTTSPPTNISHEKNSIKSTKTQKKRTEVGKVRHWVEVSATVSEADVSKTYRYTTDAARVRNLLTRRR